MRRIRVTIEFILDESFGLSEDDLMWLENEVLVGDGNLILHSNDIGDTVGVIKKVGRVQYLPNSEQEAQECDANPTSNEQNDDKK